VALCNVFAVCCNLRVVDRVRVCVCGRVILQWLSLVSMCGRGRARRRITYHARDYRLIDLLLARQETTGEWYPKPVASHLTVTVNKWGVTRNNQSIKINSINKKKKKKNPLKAPHEHKRSHIPAQPHGQQNPRREASQAWGAKSASRASVLTCVTPVET